MELNKAYRYSLRWPDRRKEETSYTEAAYPHGELHSSWKMDGNIPGGFTCLQTAETSHQLLMKQL